MKKLNKEDIQVGDRVWVEVIIDSIENIYDCGWHYGDDVFGRPLNNNCYSEDDWIPYNEDGFNTLDCKTVSLVQFKNGDMELHHLGSPVSRTDIVDYQIINPYKPSRRKVVVKDSLELHKIIIEHGKLYYGSNVDSYVLFDDEEFKVYDDEVYLFNDWHKKEWWVE